MENAMGTPGDWVALFETVEPTKRYFLLYDTQDDSGVTEHWVKPVDIKAGRRFAEDANHFVGNAGGTAYTGAAPYNAGTHVADWSRQTGEVCLRPQADISAWSEQLRAYVGA